MPPEQAKKLVTAVADCERAQARATNALREAQALAAECDCALWECVLLDHIERSSSLHLQLNELARCSRLEADAT